MKLRYSAVALVSVLLTALALGGPSLARRASSAATACKAPPVCPKFAVLLGAREVSATTGKKGAGDTNGKGSFTLIRASDHTLCYGLTVTGVDAPVAAHIHRGKRNKNGGIVVTLGTPDGGTGSSSGCLDGFSTSLTGEISKHPERFYVNVHTSAFPGGAVRGQLFASKGR